MAGTGGTGGIATPACMTNALCAACPSESLCENDQDCSTGFVCIDSGCATNEGLPIKHCLLAPAGFCDTNDDCPPDSDRECIEVEGEGKRCVKTTPGCDSTFDCVPGFSCEEGTCVDRRVPCYLDSDCPKSHICDRFDATGFCRRIHQSCESEGDCDRLAPRCADVDGDGTTECASAFDPNLPSPEACVNSMCSGSAPVCEYDGGFTDCGQYGLCKDSSDCVAGFECIGLWPDGRKECVPVGGDCDHFDDCQVRQVCASPHAGGPPSCQAGLSP
jgi:hypothetical protein